MRKHGEMKGLGMIHKEIVIRKLMENDWEKVRAIFIEGIQTGNATFQTEAPTWEEWDASHTANCRHVAVLEDQVVGWVALSPISSREAFSGVAEVSIYISGSATGMGIGGKLLEHLIEESEEQGFWTIQSMIFPENEGSIHLHKKYGFETVGTRKQMGKLNGVWRDVVLLERRSSTLGKD